MGPEGLPHRSQAERPGAQPDVRPGFLRRYLGATERGQWNPKIDGGKYSTDGPW